MTKLTCPTCGTPVRVEGKTTLYYLPLCDERIAELEEAMKEAQKLTLTITNSFIGRDIWVILKTALEGGVK